MIEFKKTIEKCMIKNLLYSICLHILLIFMLIMFDHYSKFSNVTSTNLNSLNVEYQFLMNNNIKTTDKDELPFLTLSEKIKLFLYQTENGQTFNNTGKKQDQEEIKKTLKNINNQLKNQTADGIQNKIVANSENKEGVINQLAKKEDKKRSVLYLGRVGYERLKAKNDLKAIKVIKEKEEKKMKEKTKTSKDNISNLLDIISSETKTMVDSVANTEERGIEVYEEEINDNFVENLNLNVNKIFTNDDLKKIKENINDSVRKNALTIREKILIQQQLRSCLRMAVVKNNSENKVGVFVEAELSKNGFFNMHTINLKIIDKENKYTQKDYDSAINNVKTAIIFCNPLRNLPISKFDSWQKINFTFDNINNN